MDEQCFKRRVSCPTAVGVSIGEEKTNRAMIPYLATLQKKDELSAQLGNEAVSFVLCDDQGA